EEARHGRITPEAAAATDGPATESNSDSGRMKRGAPVEASGLLAGAEAHERMPAVPEDPSARAESSQIPLDPTNLVGEPLDLHNLAPLIAPAPPTDEMKRDE